MPQHFNAADDLAACRAALAHGSRSFFTAAKLLPPRVRSPATALYAFCREADDAIDLGEDKHEAVRQLNKRLDLIYAGTPAASPVDRAFANMVNQFKMPRELPAALIEGMAWDAEGRRYQHFEDLLDYAARVAGTVGVMMALIMGVRETTALARAADLGVAMQLTNIARDVGEDAQAGRLFLPLDWLAEAGIDVDDFLLAPKVSHSIAGVVQRLLAEAEMLYTRAQAGILLLPVGCRPGIAAARRIYSEIGVQIASQNYDTITMRARVSGRRKISLAIRACADALFSPHGAPIPALAANMFLVNAAACDDQPEPSAVVKLLIMFERLERAQREAASRVTT